MLKISGRIGCFFLLIGAVLLFLFVTSDLEHIPEFNYLVAGIFIFLLGWMLFRKGYRAQHRSTRFRILHRHTEDEDE